MDEEKNSIKVINASLKSYHLDDGRILIPMHKITFMQLGTTKLSDVNENDFLKNLQGDFTFCSLTPVSYLMSDQDGFKEYKLNENEEINKWTEFLKMAINLLKKK